MVFLLSLFITDLTFAAKSINFSRLVAAPQPGVCQALLHEEMRMVRAAEKRAQDAEDFREEQEMHARIALLDVLYANLERGKAVKMDEDQREITVDFLAGRIEEGPDESYPGVFEAWIDEARRRSDWPARPEAHAFRLAEDIVNRQIIRGVL